MKKSSRLLLLTIPLIFISIVLLLNAHLNHTISNDGAKKIHLVAAHDAQIGARRFQTDRLQAKEDMDKEYDTSKLAMLGMIDNEQDEAIKSEGDKLYAFNDLLSSRLSLNRAVPDTRHPLCQEQTYRSDLPKASVIICFYNEAWSTLLRTVHSVLNRTPPELLYQIVLVDDASELTHLQNKLAEYLWTLHPNITLVRLPERQGLIRARMYGAYVATGEVLVFLDSHCEVNKQWLEPLLTAVVNTKKPTIAVPVIDTISPGGFEYKGAKLMKGGFNWGLNFRWDDIPENFFENEQSYIEPIETPTMAGGLFAVSRTNFVEMGEYDAGQDIWGGENLEISFRYWQCGGQLQIIPCSRIGHVFRTHRPYSSPDGGDSMLRNSLRVARVWMDDYIQYFFQVKPYATEVKSGDLTERITLRKKLSCKPFEWYLKYVYPEQTVPDKDGKGGNVVGGNRPQKYKPVYIKHGPIIQKESKLCMIPESAERNAKIILEDCDKHTDYQDWYETEQQELQLTEKLCLGAKEGTDKANFVLLMKCHGMGGTQTWVWSIKNFIYQLYNPTTGKCLTSMKVDSKVYVVTQICDTDRRSQYVMKPR